MSAKLTNKSWLPTPILMTATLMAIMIIRVLWFYFSPDSELITIIPDDAFYYIKLAKQHLRFGFWTFDGITMATGFHLFYGYLLLGIFNFFPAIGWRELFLIISIFALILISIAGFLTAKSAEALFGRKFAPIAVLPFLMPISYIQTTMMMESWLVVFFSSLTLFLCLSKNKMSFFTFLLLVIVGIFGSLSRTDYGLFPGVLFLSYYFTSGKRDNLTLRSGLLLLGAILGLCISLTHNLLLSGHISQASAQIKFMWSALNGHSVIPALSLVSSLLIPFSSNIIRISFLIFLALLAGLSFYLYHSKEDLIELSQFKNKSAGTLIGCLATVVGYIIFYRFNSQGIQPWYISNFITPFAITFAGIFFYFSRSIPALLISLVFGLYTVVGITKILEPLWPDQAGEMSAGLYLKSVASSNYSYGSWNAGIISYFSDRPIINLDGLVNDDVYDAIKTNNLLNYLQGRNIGYIVDFNEMLLSENFRRRGGYLDSRVSKCIEPLKATNQKVPTWLSGRLQIFKVDSNCISSNK